jgi:hypothetical protein
VARRSQAARRRRSAITAPPPAWQRLGHLLEGRRRELGHTYRTTFEAASGVNRRLAADIETAAPKRINTFMPGTMSLIAKGYQVTEESILAVLRGEADQLAPAVPPAPVPAVPAGPPGRLPPVDDASWIAAARPYHDKINKRLIALAAQGARDPSGRRPDDEGWIPSGAQMFGEGTEDAQTWDGPAAVLPRDDRMWLIAGIQRSAAARAARSGTGTEVP